MKYLILTLTLLILTVFTSVNSVFATASETDDPVFQLIPKTETNKWAENAAELGKLKAGEDFWEEYNQFGLDYAAKKETDGLGSMLASGIVTWDTILMLLTRLIKFIANAALVFGSAMFIYAGYLYVASAFAGDNTGKANDAIKNAVIGIVVVIFSYAIQKIVIEAFLDTYAVVIKVIS